jgi:hypothetical protein
MQTYIRMDGLKASLEILTKAGANARGLDTGDVYKANAELRQQAKKLADRTAADIVKPLVMRGPVPQSRKMADTIRPKLDRMPVIRIGAVNPKLSGYKKRGNPRWRTAIAHGIEYGGYKRRNLYKLPRTTRGYVIGPNMNRIARAVLPQYEDLVYVALQTAGVTSWRRVA